MPCSDFYAQLLLFHTQESTLLYVKQFCLWRKNQHGKIWEMLMVKHVFICVTTQSKTTNTLQKRKKTTRACNPTTNTIEMEWKWLTKSTSHNKHCCKLVNSSNCKCVLCMTEQWKCTWQFIWFKVIQLNSSLFFSYENSRSRQFVESLLVLFIHYVSPLSSRYIHNNWWLGRKLLKHRECSSNFRGNLS